MGGLSSWAVNIVHTNGNKLPIYKPKRAHVVSLLPKMAEAAEKEGAKKMCEVKVDSRARDTPATQLETQHPFGSRSDPCSAARPLACCRQSGSGSGAARVNVY